MISVVQSEGFILFVVVEHERSIVVQKWLTLVVFEIPELLLGTSVLVVQFKDKLSPLCLLLMLDVSVRSLIVLLLVLTKAQINVVLPLISLT